MFAPSTTPERVSPELENRRQSRFQSCSQVSTLRGVYVEDPADAPSVTDKHLEDLLLVQIAHMSFLQDVYGVLIVQGTCNKEVGKLFRTFSTNTYGLSSDAICHEIPG